VVKAILKPEIEHFKKFHLLDMMSARHLNYLREKSQVFDYTAGDVLFSPPRSPSMGYYLIQGEVEIRLNGLEKRCVTSGSDESYYSLEDKLPDDAVATALVDCTVLQLSRVMVEQYFSWSTTGVYKAVDISSINQSIEKQQTEWMKPLLNSALAKNLTNAEAESFFSLFEEKRVRERDIILHQGESNQYFYIIKSGKAKFCYPSGEEHVVQVGSYFGDESLIPDAASSVQVEMLTQGLVAKLEKQYFIQYIKNSLVKRVNLKQLEHFSREKYVLLDVRFPAEFKAGHLERAINMPLSALNRRFTELDPVRMVILTLESGARGELAAYILQQKGYRAFVLDDKKSADYFKLHA